MLWAAALCPAQNLLQIRVLEGEGAIHSAGSKASRPIVIEITDETGKPVEGAAVSFRMPEEGPGASFRENMKTDIRITAPDGRATIFDFIANRVVGPYQIRVTAVKSQVRAGIVVSQYVTDAPVKNASVSRGTKGTSGRKWLWIALAAGGGGAAAVLAGGRSGSSAPGSTGPTSPGGPAPSIGAPTITISGGPQ